MPARFASSLASESSASRSEPVVSLAFGPGLTMCGALLEKR